jgi:hypothetical protein
MNLRVEISKRSQIIWPNDKINMFGTQADMRKDTK